MNHDESEEGYSAISRRIVEKVAAKEGADPTEIDVPLDTVIDSDALEALFAETKDGKSRSNGSVRFSYYGYDVEVLADGSITVT